MTKYYTPFANKPEILKITKDIAQKFNLFSWAESFKLGTAGYRDLLDPEDFFSSQVPFNGISMAIIAQARCNIAKLHNIDSIHVGGEVRPHTKKFINLVSRIYASQNISVHLRSDNIETTPIWLSSFSVFNYGLKGGENFTASHSQFFKGGWKPMDETGMQLLDMAKEISDEVRNIVNKIMGTPLEISLSSSDDPKIIHDLDPVSNYIDMIKKIFSEISIGTIRKSLNNGMNIAISTEGGSMGSTSRKIFSELNLPMDNKGITLLHEKESANYHGIGIVDGVNYGVDPGKWQIYKNIGAQNLLRDGKTDIVFIWDPDGDRFNIITTADIKSKKRYIKFGLEVEPLDENRIIVYFKPNQIYFLLAALRMSQLIKSNDINKYNWIVAITYPTSRSIAEISEKMAQENGSKISKVFVPVGFKHFGNLVSYCETHIGKNENIIFKDVRDKTTNLYSSPRFLIMAEESGGAAMGTTEPFISKSKKNNSLSLKEKDGMQVGIATMALAAQLFEKNRSFADEYIELIEKYNIESIIYERKDITLYDESLKGEARALAKNRGELLKNSIVTFFKNLTFKDPEEATLILRKQTNNPNFPKVLEIFWAGDGTFIQFKDGWFEIRASGTDAVLRYYFEGENREIVSTINGELSRIKP